MLKLEEFLRKFEPIRSHKKNIEKEILSWCLKELPFVLDDLETKLRHPTLVVSTKNMAAKNTIFLKQNELLDFLFQKFGKKAPTKILFK